jgi:alpha-tubulin suppressor-like RCC1 family protein
MWKSKQFASTKFGMLAMLSLLAFPPSRSADAAEVISIWGGARETVVLKSDGTVWDWGFNWFGHLGDGTVSTFTPPDFSNDKHIPIEVHGPGGVGYLHSISAIMGGESHNMALKSDGTVWAWGMNGLNQIGDGTTNNAVLPVQVSNLNSIVSLGGRGYHSLAIKADGTVWAWGFNGSGQLGNGTTSPSSVPVQVAGITGPVSVSAGYTISAALMTNGTVWMWGTGGSGELGNGTTGHSYSPVQVVGLSNVTAISCGWNHTLAVKSDGTAWAWGLNSHGELGDGTTNNQAIPVRVLNVSNVVSVSGGDWHSAALTADGTVWKWGRNDVGQLGLGMTNSGANPLPALILGFTNVIKVAARDYHNIALKADGSVWMWGANDHGQCGINTTNDVWNPVQVFGLGPRVGLKVNGHKNPQSGNLDLSWSSGTGEYFGIETSANLVNWTLITNNIQSTPPLTTLSLSATNGHSFYRLKY